MKTLIERFLAKACRWGNGCWAWTGNMQPPPSLPYGRFKINGRNLYAHRVSWMLYNGKIPEGLLVLHTCDNPRCVNPDHLFLGTHQINSDDCRKKGRMPNHEGEHPGEENGAAKLTREAVLEIRRLYKPRVKGLVISIASRFGISIGTVYAILQKTRWKHV